MYVKSVSTTALTLLFVVFGYAQLETAGTSKFHWDWRNEKELTWKQSISRSKYLDESVRHRLFETMVKLYRPSMDDLDIKSELELVQVASATRIGFAYLGSGVNVVIAQGGGDKSGCSPTGNCPFWVLRTAKDGYSVLLDGEAQTYTIQTTRTKGLRDIVLARHGSAFDSELTVYRFNGKKYGAGECYIASWRDRGLAPRINVCGAE